MATWTSVMCLAIAYSMGICVGWYYRGREMSKNDYQWGPVMRWIIEKMRYLIDKSPVGFVAVVMALGLALSWGLAALGHPSAVWLWCQMLHLCEHP